MTNVEGWRRPNDEPIWERVANDPSLADLDNRIDAIIDRKNREVALLGELIGHQFDVSPLTSVISAEHKQLYNQLYQGPNPENDKLLTHQQSVTLNVLSLYGVKPETVEAQRLRDTIGFEFVHEGTRILFEATGKSLTVRTLNPNASFEEKWYEEAHSGEQTVQNARSFSLRSRRFSWNIPMAMELASASLSEVTGIITEEDNHLALEAASLIVVGPETIETQRGDRAWRFNDYGKLGNIR